MPDWGGSLAKIKGRCSFGAISKKLVAWFQTSAEEQRKSALFRVITQCIQAIPYGRFGTTYGFHIQASTNPGRKIREFRDPWIWDR